MLSRTALAASTLVVALAVPAPLALAQQAARSGMPGLEAFSRRLMNDMAQAGETLAGEALAQWIRASRQDALSAGVDPMPAAVRARLKGHFPDALLQRVRYRVGTGREFTLQSNAFKNRADAITLGEVILFRPAHDGVNDPQLWAHELTHVQQYDRWGVRGFAQRYAVDHRVVEAEARANAARIGAALASSAP